MDPLKLQQEDQAKSCNHHERCDTRAPWEDLCIRIGHVDGLHVIKRVLYLQY